MAQIKINNLDALKHLGAILGANISSYSLPPIFLRGDLGSGKTTLTQAIVSQLKGSENAECGSPSFNIYNIYPTDPIVFHCDLYRCSSQIPEELLEILENRKQLLILEWAEFLSPKNYPLDYLDISFNLADYGRLLSLTAYGEDSQGLLKKIVEIWKP